MVARALSNITCCHHRAQATEDLYAALDARQQLLAQPTPSSDVLAAAAAAEADVRAGPAAMLAVLLPLCCGGMFLKAREVLCHLLSSCAGY
jgi:hypothetical protein